MPRLARVLLVGALASGVAACGPGETAGPPPPAPTAGGAAGREGVRRDLVEVPDRGEASVRADLDLGLGTVSVGEAEPGTLFQADIALPVSGLTTEFETATVPTESGPQARLSLGLSGDAQARLRDLRDTRGLAWRLLFSHGTPLDLSVRVGAAESDLDLTGVPLRRLALVCGVARTRLSLHAPNPERAGDVSVQAGVSDFSATGLGHLRFRRLTFDGGVGRFALDFRGAPAEPGATAALRVGMGELDVVLPAGQPVVVDAPGGRLSSVRLPAGLVTLGGGRFASPGAGPDALRVRIASGPGSVRVRFAGPLPSAPPPPPPPPTPPAPPEPPHARRPPPEGGGRLGA